MDPRILVISAADKNDRSAYTHRILKLAECLEERSVRCDFFFMPNNPPLDTETTASLFMPFWLRKLNQYDLIYCGAQEAGQTLFFCGHFVRPPKLLDIHGDVIAQSALANELETGGKKRTASLRVEMIDRLAMACADHFLTVSTFQTEVFLKRGIPPERISLIRNGVDLDLFQPLPQPKEPLYTFAYIGEFQSWQGIDNLIKSFQLVQTPSIKMLVVGFRECDRPIKEVFREKFGSRVELVDRTDRNTLVDLVRSVSILMIPRVEHNAIKHAFPTKFAEYAAMGRPVLVNDVDETARFVQKYACGFVSKPTPEGMAAVMHRASEVPYEKLAEMGQRSRKMAEENFSWPKIGDEYFRVVMKLISAFRKGQRL
ncbi:glycosyltransferase [Desulfomonile tiedjei]|uniref:Glycosyltransferase n=1 Tax=Desulfomonile tiedjei (strain ATCC 49306 / DSM 6799 / DCB-1) TaxID=706587 RepID=I4C281_DESTA|nr:glycosyltransferase [Desulfomonile tiedjei]AFM23672.1 glycosyltransferase [Desulfomonile tiedjei DSM 6799]